MPASIYVSSCATPPHLRAPGELSLVDQSWCSGSTAWVSDTHEVGSLSTGLSELTYSISSAVHSLAECLNLPLLGMGGDESACLTQNLRERGVTNDDTQ